MYRKTRDGDVIEVYDSVVIWKGNDTGFILPPNHLAYLPEEALEDGLTFRLIPARGEPHGLDEVIEYLEEELK